MTPLDIVKALWTSKALTVPFFVTVNTPITTDELPDPWASALYQPGETAFRTLGSQPWIEEEGKITVGLFTRSGLAPGAQPGDTKLDQAVAEVKLAFMGADTQGLRVWSIGGPYDPNPDGNGEWWGLALELNYTYQSRGSRWTP